MEKKDKTLNVPNLRFPEFSGEWKAVPLSTIADIIGGGTPDTSVDEYWGGNIQWFTPSEIGKGKYAYLSDRTITEAGLKNSSAKLLPQGTVLLSTRATIGECSIATTECTTNQGFQSLVAKENNVSSEFLYYIVAKIKREMLRRSCGSTFLEISANELKKIHTNIPSKAEQEKLVSLLSLIDQRIETQKKIIEKYESLIRGLTDTAFNCKSSIPLINFSNLYKDAGEGGTPSTSNSEYYDGGTIPFIKIDDIMTKYLVTHKDCITEQGMQKSSAWLIPSGSVIYSNGATIGSIAINTYPVCTKQGILGIIPKDNVDVEYLYYFMTSVYFRKEIHRIITEGTMKTAYLKDINKILCPLPDLATQRSIANKLASMTKKIELDKRTLSLLHTQKKYLLSHLFI